MIRWLRKRRYDRCRKQNHPFTEIKRDSFFEWPSKRMFHAVADDVETCTTSCRCGKRKMVEELSRSHLTGLSMPSADWKILRREGRL